MTTSFQSLKRSSGNLDKLAKAIESMSSSEGSGGKDDNRFWKCETDKAGNGYAIIRFLPAPAADGDDSLPWVKIFHHGFQGPGGWLIDNCLTTLNQKCPVCEHNSELWNSGIEANKEIVRKQKRKLSYICNIYVVSDTKNPDNNGKVFLFKFGKKIFDKITAAMHPEFGDETPINPFDLWSGANFKLKIRKVEGYQNYDKSEFDNPGALSDDDDDLEKIWKSEYSLKEFLAEDQFKSYDKLKERLNKALGLSGMIPKTRAEDVEFVQQQMQTKQKSSIETEQRQVSKMPDLNEEDDDDIKYFERLALED